MTALLLMYVPLSSLFCCRARVGILHKIRLTDAIAFQIVAGMDESKVGNSEAVDLYVASQRSESRSHVFSLASQMSLSTNNSDSNLSEMFATVFMGIYVFF